MVNYKVLDDEVKALKEDIAGLKGDIKELTEAWIAMKGTANFLKWFVSIVISLVSGYIFIKEHLFK